MEEENNYLSISQSDLSNWGVESEHTVEFPIQYSFSFC